MNSALPRRRWLHRLGYLTTTIVILQLMAGSIVLLVSWSNERQRAALTRERTRTHVGMPPQAMRDLQPWDGERLAGLPPMGSDSLRFFAYPALRDPSFAIALDVPSNGRRAIGRIVIFPDEARDETANIAPRIIDFTLSRDGGNRLLRDAAARTDGWAGDTTACLDGTSVAFRLSVQGSRSWGKGNAACSDHYRALDELILHRLGPAIPADVRPADGKWRPAIQP